MVSPSSSAHRKTKLHNEKKLVKKKQCSPKLPMMMYVCYLCGREYGSKSIAIHEKRCLVIMEKQGKITKKIKRPPLEEAKSLQERNAMAIAAFEKSMMVRCPGCQRTFHGEDKLAKHMKGCEDAKKRERRENNRRNLRRQPSITITTPTSQSVSCSSSSSLKKKHRPLGPSVSEPILNIAKDSENFQNSDENSPTNNSSGMNLICYLCGRMEFDALSIEDHEARCLEAKRQQVKISFAKNNIVPRPSFETAKTVKERNAMARRAFESMQKPRCPGCYRTFNGEDKLSKHMKGCEELKQQQRCKPVPSRLQRSNSSRSSVSSRPALKRRLSSQEKLSEQQLTINSSASLPLMRTPEVASSSEEEAENTRSSSSSSIRSSGGKRELSSSRKNKLRFLSPTTSSSFRSPLEKLESFKVLEEQISVAQKTFETSLAMVVKDYKCTGCQRAFDAEEKLSRHQKGCQEYMQQMEAEAKYGIRDCIVPKKFDASSSKKRNRVKREEKDRNIDKNKKSSTVIPNPNEAAVMDIFFASPRGQECKGSRYDSEDDQEIQRSKSLTPQAQPTNLERKFSAQKKFETMEECPGCKRTFNAKVKLLKHMKGCKEVKKQQTAKVSIAQNSYDLPKWLSNIDTEDKNEYDDIAFYCQPVTETKNHDPNCDFHNMKVYQKASLLPPKTYLCYICGRQYGSKSIQIHEKKCLELFQRRQQQEEHPKDVTLPSVLPPAGDPTTRVKRNAMIMELQQQANVFPQCGGCHQTMEQKIFGVS